MFRSELFELADGPLALGRTGVEGGFRFKQHDVRLFLRSRAVLHSARYDDEIPLVKGFHTISELHIEGSLDYEKKLVFMIVLMPVKLTFDLCQSDVLTVETSDDPWIPVI